MQETWRQRATVGSLGLALGLSVLVPIATARARGPADSVERQTIEQTAYDDMGRAARGSREFPTPTLTLVGQGDDGFGASTASGGAYFPGLGTVSHASIDNTWALSGTRRAPRMVAGLGHEAD